jgi:hypothetical protein
MPSDDKKAKPDPTPKKEPAPKDTSASPADTAKTESTEKAAAPSSSYSRGEGQKPVTQAYKDNWNVIFGPKKRTKKR